MDIFKGQNLLEFSDRFKTDLDCKEYFAGIRWKEGFKCVKCDHGAAQVGKNFSRTCNICGHTESAMANSLFHEVKFGVRKAFSICFEMAIIIFPKTKRCSWLLAFAVALPLFRPSHLEIIPY